MTGATRSNNTAFTVLWGGQLVSLLGSAATTFALGLAVYAQTRSASAIALVTAVSSLGGIYLAPLCGAVVDQLGKRRAILVGNLGSGAVSLALAWVAWAGAGDRLPVLLGLVFAGALLNAGLSVALAASVRELRAEADLTRINGITSFLESIPTLAGPVLGAAVYSLADPALVFVFDGLTFFACALAVATMRWESRSEGAACSPRPFAGAAQGVRFILVHTGFRRLQLTFAGVNCLNGLSVAAITAFVVAASSADATSWNLAAVTVAGATGLLVGSALVTVIGSRVSRPFLVGGGVVGSAVLGRFLLAATALPPLWVAASVLRNVAVQVSNAPLTAVWQEQVPAPIQATVFGARRLLGQGLYPLAVLIGGLIDDHVLGPDSPIANSVSGLGGVFAGPAAGSALLLFVAGAGELVLGICLLATPRIRHLLRAPSLAETKMVS